MLRLDARLLAVLKELLDATLPKSSDHSQSVTYNVTLCKANIRVD
jgi:hypothetical protein